MKRKTILIFEATNKEFHVQYNGSFTREPDTKENFKHDARLIMALTSDKELFDFFYRIVEPARRYYMREERKKRKAERDNQ